MELLRLRQPRGGHDQSWDGEWRQGCLARRSTTANELQRLAEQGFSEPVYVVKVHNRGRGATSVTDVDLYFSDGGAMGHTGIQRGLPRRVEGESDATFPIEANLATTYDVTAIRKVRGWRSPPMVRARVTIGAREKPVLSKNELPVGWENPATGGEASGGDSPA